MWLIMESPILDVPRNVKNVKENVRFECILQTVGVVNKNKRRYSREVLEEGLSKVRKRIKDGAVLGELDHPLDKNPIRQMTVMYKEASHRILDYWWDGNKLMGVIETLRTPNGNILKNLVEDGVPVGFSFRGMGDLKTITEGGKSVYEVVSPLHVITWDAVSNPSHEDARIIRTLREGSEYFESKLRSKSRVIYLSEDALYRMYESLKRIIDDSKRRGILNECLNNGIVCTEEGVCYILNR